MASGASVHYRLVVVAILLLLGWQEVSAYGASIDGNLFTDVLLSELLSRMDKDIDQVNSYFDIEELPKSVDLVSRSSKNSDDYDYRNVFAGGGSSNPSLRDQEYLQHSSLWGHQYVSGGMGEVPNRYHPIVKTDASLPAYCNPPNPCPYGYEESQGCITDFENTAIFSREFQAAQQCTCDNEHMFDCAGQESAHHNEMTSTMEKFLMHQFQNENGLDNANAVVKKFYKGDSHGLNPYLQGDKLPIAAKKGDHLTI